jgi:hypothetical protein
VRNGVHPGAAGPSPSVLFFANTLRVRDLPPSADLPRPQATSIAPAGMSALNRLAVWWWDHPYLMADTLAAVAMDLL